MKVIYLFHMKKQFVLLACIACILCVFSGCCSKDKDSTNPEIKITIYGNVSDADSGAPLIDVSVSALSEDGQEIIANTVTDNDGDYEIEVSTESFSNTIRAENTKYETVELVIEKSGSWTNNQKYKADIEMHKQVVIYKGVIKDSKGNKLAGAQIDVSRGTGSGAQKLARATSDKNGEYSVEVPRVVDSKDPANQKKSWTNYVTVSKAGYVSNSQSISHTVSDLGKTYQVNVTLQEEIN